MKKVIYTIIIILFTMTEISNAQFFRSQDNDNSGSSTGITNVFGNSSRNSEDDNSSSGFFRSPDSGSLDDRPGNGDGIGQEAPLGDGLPVFIICCSVLGVVKLVQMKKKK